MNASLGTETDKKLNRMHTMALGLYRGGDHHSALKIWRRIQETKSDFPEIEKWIDNANRMLQAQIPQKNVPSPSVFREQRDIMAHHGQGPRRRVFHPKTSHVRLKNSVRHRHVFYVFLILVFSIVLLSVRNNRSYLIMLNPVTHKLDCFQGNFFPVGWQRTLELEVGIESDWVKYVGDQDIISRLKKGIKTRSAKRFDEILIEVFMTLGDESLVQMTERGQQSAVYYYRRISEARYSEQVSQKIVRAFINLVRIKITEKDYENARKYLKLAHEHGIPDAGLMDLHREIEAAQQSISRLY